MGFNVEQADKILERVERRVINWFGWGVGHEVVFLSGQVVFMSLFAIREPRFVILNPCSLFSWLGSLF